VTQGRDHLTLTGEAEAGSLLERIMIGPRGGRQKGKAKHHHSTQTLETREHNPFSLGAWLLFPVAQPTPEDLRGRCANIESPYRRRTQVVARFAVVCMNRPLINRAAAWETVIGSIVLASN
jgi:hypothetical protein